MSSFSLMQFLFAPMWGRVSDRVGRRPILLLGLVGSVVFYALFGYAASLKPGENAQLALTLFFVARIGAGIAGATIATAQAVIADSTPPDKRKHGMALIGAAFGIGFTFGPLIGFGGLWLTGNYLPTIGYTASALSAVALVLGMILLPETRVFSQDSTARRHLLDPSAIGHALRDSAIAPVILTFFTASLGFGAFEVTLALFLKDTFRFGENNSFLVFAYIGFVLMLTQGVLYRRLASRVSEVTFIGMGIIFMGVGVALMGLIAKLVDAGHEPDAWLMTLLFAALSAAVIGFAFLTPSAQALISRRTSADRQGEILGVNQSASALARILGPMVGVPLYTATESHLLPYIAGAVLLLLMLPLLPRIRRTG
jgi:MFS family permease